jgi:hypothetical protein
MALSRLTNWTDGDILTSAALEAEFDNIYNNALTLISPLTGNLAAGGNIITGIGAGSAASPSLQVRETDTGVYSSGAGILDFTVGAVRRMGIDETDPGFFDIFGLSAGANGPVLRLFHNSASPANNDNGGVIQFNNKDAGGTSRAIGSIAVLHEDITAASQDSAIHFGVQNAVNAGDLNTTATLSSLGVWTDASGAEGKEFFGDVLDILGKMRALTVGVYRGRNIPPEKQATAERHFSSTAEDFYAVFGLGRNPGRGAPGIASKDVAFLGMRGLLELDDKVTALDRRVESLEGGRPIPGGR